jgi:Rps23 Pro-64 3,4-dihydroxylase Tpa1-like proline 4-hydroxylase
LLRIPSGLPDRGYRRGHFLNTHEDDEGKNDGAAYVLNPPPGSVVAWGGPWLTLPSARRLSVTGWLRRIAAA